MNPLFQLSTRSYDKEITVVKEALKELEKECKNVEQFSIEPIAKNTHEVLIEGFRTTCGSLLAKASGHSLILELDTEGWNLKRKQP